MNTKEYMLKRFDVLEEPVIWMRGRSRWASLTRLFRELNFKLGAEVGTERGRFAKIICQVNPQLKLYAIDAWTEYEGYREHVPQERLDNFYIETRARMKSFNCQLIRDWSVEAAKRFADKSLDFVFIDANHDYKYVKEDIEAWAPKVRSGGLVCGHDYINGLHGITYGVRQAVNEWVKENNISPLFIFKKDDCPSWVYVQP